MSKKQDKDMSRFIWDDNDIEFRQEAKKSKKIKEPDISSEDEEALDIAEKKREAKSKESKKLDQSNNADEWEPFYPPTIGD